MNDSSSPAAGGAPRRLSVAFALAVGGVAVLAILAEPLTGADLAFALVTAIGALLYLTARSVQDISERREAYAALKASEERFRALATQSPGGIYEVDHRGDGHLRERAAGAEMAGLAEPATSVGALPRPGAPRRPRAGDQAVGPVGRRRAGPSRWNTACCGPGGSVTWVSGRATTVHDADGAPAGYFGAALDITGAPPDRGRAATPGRDHGEHGRGRGAGPSLRRPDRVRQPPLRGDLRLRGPASWTGMDVNRINAPGGRRPARRDRGDPERRRRVRVLDRRRPQPQEGRHGLLDHATVSVFEHPEHGLVSVAVHEDITDRKRGDDELRHERRMLAESQQIGRVGSWQWDLDSNEVSWSREQFRLYGLDPADGTPHRPTSWRSCTPMTARGRRVDGPLDGVAGAVHVRVPGLSATRSAPSSSGRPRVRSTRRWRARPATSLPSARRSAPFARPRSAFAGRSRTPRSAWRSSASTALRE